MGRFSRVVLLIGIIVFPTFVFAQFNNNTSSPYSRYGLGDLHSYSFGRSVAMGGATIGSRYNKQINLGNPASYSSIDSLGFMFDFGMNASRTKSKNDLGSSSQNDVNFEYFAMNFRVSNRSGAVLGLVPFSDVGYNVVIEEEVANTGTVETDYYGTGTISKAFLGFAYEPFKFLSIGANLNYTFGMLNRNSEVYFLDGSGYYQIQQYKNLRLSDFSVDFGIQATIPIKANQKLILGAVFENNPTYNARFSDITQKNLVVGSSVDQDTLYSVEEGEKGIIEIPVSYGFGISYVKDNKWEINADFYHQAWGDAKFFGEKSAFLTDLNKFAVGAEWIPDKFSIRSYVRRVAYRLGANYEQTYLIFDGHHINKIGISFGVGLPIYRSNSTINVAAEFGKRGTTDYNLLLENYARLNVSVNLYDLWFIKRRFD
ncbi:MAG: hypothetical protein R2757_04100 [Draconibacterium sp.]